ncbi:MAG: hypothetical protein ACXIUV_06735 [Alkalilacustris sp.]
MRRAAALLVLMALAACGTPFDRCVRPVQAELRTVDRLIAETEGNIARGFAIERQNQIIQERVPCLDSDGFRTWCLAPVVTETRRPVAIDRDVERGKLATLRARRSELQALAVVTEARCRAEFPEG